MWGAILGSVASSIYQNEEAKKASSKQRGWQENMSNTAHQREVSDLRAAGLNPVLSGTGGQGASTPSGAMSNTPNFSDSLNKGIESGQKGKKLSPEVKEMNSRTELNEMSREKAWEETKNLNKQGQILDAAVLKARNDAKMYNTKYGRNLRPYTSDIFKAIGVMK